MQPNCVTHQGEAAYQISNRYHHVKYEPDVRVTVQLNIRVIKWEKMA